MFKKCATVAAAALALVVAGGTAASAQEGYHQHHHRMVMGDGDQDGLLNLDAPAVVAACAAPWFGSAVLGGSLPIGSENIVCDDIHGTVTQDESGHNGLL